jgi:hypothetical protein
MKQIFYLLSILILFSCQKETIVKEPAKHDTIIIIKPVEKPKDSIPVIVEIKDTIFITVSGGIETSDYKTISFENYFSFEMDSTFESKSFVIFKLKSDTLGIIEYFSDSYKRQCQGLKILFRYHNNYTTVGCCGYGRFKWLIYIAFNKICYKQL